MKIYIGKSKLQGKGIFASQDIKRNRTVSIIRGKVVSWVVVDKKSSAFAPNWIGLGKNKWIDPEPPFNYLNHSCNPNIGIKGSRTIVALKNIKKGEELLIDYSITENDKLWQLEKKCRCGSKNCRKIIRSIQSLPREVYNKYMPFVPRFFQKVYVSHHKKNGK